MSDIRQCLENGKELSNEHKIWLQYHRAYYLKTPDRYPVYKIFALDRLNPLLERDWKLKKLNVTKKLPFEEFVIQLRYHLIKGKKMTQQQKSWLSLQRLYYKQNDNKMTESKIKSLDSLNILLGYDWKTYAKDR